MNFRTIKNALFEHPRAHLNLVKRAIFKRFYPLNPPFAPECIQIEVNTSCNLLCQRCEKWILPKSEWNRNIDLDFVKRLQPILKQIHWVSFSGLGEPFSHPNFWDIHNFFKKQGVSVSFTTNGILLNDENIKKIFEYKTDSIDVSIDSLNRKTHNRIRGFDCYDKAVNGLRNLVEMKKRSGVRKPIIAIGFAIQKNTIEEVPDVVDFAKRSGVDKIWFTAVTAHFPAMAKYSIFDLKPAYIKKIFDEAQKRADLYNIEIRLPNIYGINTRREPCTYLWDMMMIYSNGDVTCSPHLRFAHGKIHSFTIQNGRLIKGKKFVPTVILGNINRERIDKIWRNERYRRLRAENRRNVNEGCNLCYFRYNIH